MISSLRQLVQVVQSCVKLILVGLFCPLLLQEFTKSFTVVLVEGYPQQDILHPFTWINVQGLAIVHPGSVNGNQKCSAVGISSAVISASRLQYSAKVKVPYILSTFLSN